MIVREGGFTTDEIHRSTAGDPAADWSAFLATVERAVAGRGQWNGEARYLRDAAGILRFGRANWARVTEQLAAQGLEVEPARQPFESDSICIRPSGWADWEASGRFFADRLADAERRVPANALWREEVVLESAIGEWIGSMHRAGWALHRSEKVP
jgi:hypothetical protein